MCPTEITYTLPSSNDGESRKVHTGDAVIETENARRVAEIFPKEVFNPEELKVYGLSHYETAGFNHGGYRTELNKEGLFLGIECFGSDRKGSAYKEDPFYRPYIGLKIPHIEIDYRNNRKELPRSTFYPSLGLNIVLLDVENEYDPDHRKVDFLIVGPKSGEGFVRLSLVKLRKDLNNKKPYKYHEMRYILGDSEEEILTSRREHWSIENYFDYVKIYYPEINKEELFIPNEESEEYLRIIKKITGIDAPFFALKENVLCIGI